MDSTTTIIGLAVLVLCIAPIIYFEMAKKAKRRKALNAFLLLAERHKLNISEYDLWNRSAIGIDKETNKLLYVLNNGQETEETAVDLKAIQKCRIIRTTHEQDRKAGAESVVDCIYLGLLAKQTKTETLLLFYGANDSLTITDELRLAEKWAQIIGKQL